MRSKRLRFACLLATAVVAPNALATASGPDFYMVSGSVGEAPPALRAGPSMEERVIGELDSGTIVRNLGCEGEGSDRWCRVGSLQDDSLDGWLPAQSLTESGPPAAQAGVGGVLSEGDGDGQPSLYQRGSGEYEVNFKGGCGALFDAGGRKITAGSSCSSEQIGAAKAAVDAARKP